MGRSLGRRNPTTDLARSPLATDVLIAADGDLAGVNAAHKAAELWYSESRRVAITKPPDGEDFNDLLQKKENR